MAIRSPNRASGRGYDRAHDGQSQAAVLRRPLRTLRPLRLIPLIPLLRILMWRITARSIPVRKILMLWVRTEMGGVAGREDRFQRLRRNSVPTIGESKGQTLLCLFQVDL